MTQTPQQTIGPYQLETALGQGGMGQVYRAWDQRLQRRVALKFLHAHRPDQAQAMLHEARMIATLNHPHIMQIYDILQEGERSVLVLEWVDGVNLRQLQGQRPLPPFQAYHYGRQILQAISAAHRLGIIHGDLKAENIMVNNEGQIKVLDFGLARQRQLSDEPARNAGTSRCMSPEQIQGHELDGRADLFSFGVLLYEMLSGQSPFMRESNSATIQAVLYEPATRLDQINPQLSPRVAQFVGQLLSKDIAQRPPNADLCLLELESLRQFLTQETALPAAASMTLPLDAMGLSQSLPGQSLPGQSTPAQNAPGYSLSIDHLPTQQTPYSSHSQSQPRHAGDGLTQPNFTWEQNYTTPLAGVTQTLASRPEAATAPRRPRYTLTLATLGAIALSSLFWWFGTQQAAGPAQLRYIAIAPPSISGVSNSEQTATLGAAINLAARQELENHQGLVVLPEETIRGLDREEYQLALATGADEIISASLVCAGNECNAQLERLDHQQQRLWSRSFSSPPEAPLLYRALRVYLQEAYQDLPRLRSEANPVNPTDLDRLLWLQGEFERNEMQHLDSAEMLARVDELLQHSPHFEEAHLLRSRILLYRYHQHADPNDLTRAREALDQVGVSPGSSLVLFEIAMVQEDYTAAHQALEQYASLQPGSATILAMRSRLAEREGEPERALILMHEAAARQPSWRHWFWAAEMSYRQGDIGTARQDLEALLGLVPEHYGGLSLLAELEMQDGQLNAAEAIYRRLVLRSAQLTELSNLGTVYLFQAHYDEAQECFRRALALAKDNPYVRLNLADAMDLGGDKTAAREEYQGLVDELSKHPELESQVNLQATLAQAQAHLGLGLEADMTVQSLLQRTQHQGQTLYTAALVYAILGQTEQARDYRERARQAGIDNIWFNLPWFK